VGISSVYTSQTKRTLAGITDDTQRRGHILRGYSTLAILRVALVEGWALFGSVTVLITGSLIALGAPIIAVGIMVAMFPSLRSFESFASRVQN
jgi:hypothetical protein